MKGGSFLLMFVLCLGTGPVWAEEGTDAGVRSPAAHRTGLSMSMGTSFLTCIPNGNADCSNAYPGPGITGSVEVRFWRMGIAVESDHGWHTVGGAGADDVSSSSLHVVPMVKGYYPLPGMEAFFGLGMGYSALSVTDTATRSEASWSTFWQGAKFSGGIWLDLEPYGAPAGCSLDAAANLYLGFGGTRCTLYGGAGPCLSDADLDANQQEVASQLQLATAFRYTF